MRKNEKGQASIMIGMMMMTFILFFAFVVNTGMLVNAKINLQNAADLAAYSGASAQARILTQISYLNYEMRRQYKKFLFRYYVMGNMAQVPFPRTGAGGSGKSPAHWSPNGNKNYNAPVVCMIFNSSDNFCQLDVLPKIQIPDKNPLDAINNTLVDQLKKIETIRQDNCLNIALTNTTVLRLWLWNTDPSLENLPKSMPQNLTKSINTIQGLSYGLGLIPREVILRQRLETLEEYINEPAHTQVRLDNMSAFQKDIDPVTKERTIEAFLSAYYTLGNHTFAASDIVMDELTPKNLIKLQNIKTRFDAYAVTFEIGAGGGNGDKGSDCIPSVEADTVQSEFPVGVYKDRSVLTYYAIRLKAKAKVMFSPFGDMELKAYAAAQPFGSRIGPQLVDDDWVRKDVAVGFPLPPGGNFKFSKQIPNLPIRESGDTAGAGNGWDTREALGGFYSMFSNPAQQGAMPPSIGQDELNRAYQAAMAPNPYEVAKYNVINDIGDDPFVRNFDSTGSAAFWAPIISPSKMAGAAAKIQGIVDSLMGDAGKDPAAFRAGIQKELTNYFDKLHQGKGENIGGGAEGFNIVRIGNPITLPGPTGQPVPINIPGDLAMTDPKKLKSSWNGVLSSQFREQGRVGYSVKFVSFDSLLHRTNPTDGQNGWTNGLQPVEDSDMDLPLIKH